MPTDDDKIREILKLTRNARVGLEQAEHRLEALLPGPTSGPVLTAAEAKRLDLFGRWAGAHEDLETSLGGTMTRGDSAALRRSRTASVREMRATVKLFGPDEHSLKILYRIGGPRAKDSDQVKLTIEGRRMARLWREAHPGETP